MLTNLEAVFRSFKTDLGLHPVYHKNDGRTDGHLFISVLAYYVVHTLPSPQGRRRQRLLENAAR